MAHDGLFGLTSGSPSYTKTQLTATLAQLTTFDGSPVRVSVQVFMHLCVHAGMCVWDHRCACMSVRACVCSPGEPLWPDGVSDGTLITQPSKGGLSWVEVSGGLMAVWWSEKLPVGKRRVYPAITQTCTHSHRWAIRVDSSQRDTRLTHSVFSCMCFYIFLFKFDILVTQSANN